MFAVGDTILDKYRIERELGRGGMGVVVVAHHVDLDERVAIKFIQGDYAKSAEVVARFMREARAAAKLKSDHVVRVTDVGRLPSGEPYMIMELLEGDDLQKTLERRGPLPIAEAIDYVLEALEAVAAAHANGIVHRDLKPANMFLARKRDGRTIVKVLDFGISKVAASGATSGGLTATQGILGSPLYMSPEHLASARDVDARTDIWAMGVIVYQLLTNDYPFMGDQLAQLIAKVLQADAIPLRQRRPEIPPELESVVMRALSKDRSARWSSAYELARALAPFGSTAALASAERIGTILGEGAALARTELASVGELERNSRVNTNPRPVVTASVPNRTTMSAWGATNANATTASSPPRKSAVPLVAGLFALLVTGALGGLAAMRWGRADPPPRASSSETNPDPQPTASHRPEAAAPPATSVAPDPGPPPVAPTDSASATKPLDQKSAPKPKPPTPLKSASPTVTVPPPPPPPAPTNNCSPPYYFDDEGIKHYKPGCKG